MESPHAKRKVGKEVVKQRRRGEWFCGWNFLSWVVVGTHLKWMSELGHPEAKKPALTGEGLQILGDVRLGRDAVIRAKVKGNVRTSGKLILTAEASVSGFVEGQDVRLEGRVDGGLQGRGQVWLGPQAILRTRCRAKALRIEAGADFKGELSVGG